ncbi:hypothetical protein [Mycolicibacterium hassiacum]|uniref:hypothetical protein n=1 Tax=Mycolicibacterium hassiacum TaxID=46351 RepID=UPI00030C5706|nr:hypothetical protein [Mycolicibacterium hassiacum]
MTVTKVGSDQSITLKASHKMMLIDHLYASAARHRLEVAPFREYQRGDIILDGQVVAKWEVTVE